jgi:hypothetical protein
MKYRACGFVSAFVVTSIDSMYVMFLQQQQQPSFLVPSKLGSSHQ